MLRVSDLRVSYGRIEVLHGISFEAKAGEVTCLIGPNGAIGMKLSIGRRYNFNRFSLLTQSLV